MSRHPRWTRPGDIALSVRRHWADGSLQRSWALDEPFVPIEIPLRGPTARELGESLSEARAWADSIHRGSHDGRAYSLVTGMIGGRLVGATDLPTRAIVSTFAQAWRLLGTESQAAAFRELVATTSDSALREWALEHPLAAIDLVPEWDSLCAALAWLAANRASGLYLRQITAPGVDTKFVERHRGVLAAALGVPAREFERNLGLAVKPSMVRLRFDPAVFGLPPELTEATFRTTELSVVPARPSRAIVVENEISYLSVPVPPGGVVLWGKGYDAHEPASLTWLRDTPVDYWGDIDTHGFAILNRVRAHLPQVRSILMDRETLLAHRERWGAEPKPTAAPLGNLTDGERALYEDLVTDRYCPSLRLEQERIDWAWALDRFSPALPHTPGV